MTTRRASGMRKIAGCLRVLIVDDNHDSAALLSVLLSREGHETCVAYDAREAIRLAFQVCPQVAFLDIGLPGMDGVELLRILRAMPELSSCKFVAATSYEELPAAASGAGGFDAHLVKPLNLDAVVNLVRELGALRNGCATPASA
jgi:CheY-like chemotaxis protein